MINSKLLDMMQDSSSNVQQNETINLLQSTLQSISVIQYPVVLPSMIDPLQSPSKILELSLLQLCTISDTSDCFLITICCVSIVIKLLFRHQNIKTTRNYSDEIIKYSSHLSLIRSQFLYFFSKIVNQIQVDAYVGSKPTGRNSYGFTS